MRPDRAWSATAVAVCLAACGTLGGGATDSVATGSDAAGDAAPGTDALPNGLDSTVPGTDSSVVGTEAAPTGTDAANVPYSMSDDLRGSTIGSAVGGSFDTNGWTVTGPTDLVWWALPVLESGSIEFTMANVTLANLPLNDHEVFAMYDAGYGISEPINYSPEFRDNHYKCMLRIYGTAEIGREGQQKLMWGMCPDGTPGYGACVCPTQFFEEPFGGSGAWDGSAERIRIEWGGGWTRYFRNGSEVLAIDWSASGTYFGPADLHFSLGTSRPAAVGTAGMPVGATFSDVVVDGITGGVATCGG